MSGASRTVLLFDDDCGFCRWSAERIRRLDRRGRLVFAAIQTAPGAELLRAVPPQLRLTTMHAVTADGRVWSGGEAVRVLLQELPLGGPFAALAGAFPDATDRLYRLVARHRETLGRWLGQDACAVDPSRSV
jgi:predicted DCC family thiol-disulfide oxidoreductase YuxK